MMKKLKKTLSLILALVMCLSLVNLSAFADTSDPDNNVMPVDDDPVVEGDPVAVTGVTLDQDAVEIKVGEAATLTASVEPADATNTTVSWATSDEAVATVDENGVVTAVAAGSATITVTTEDGEFTAACTVTVAEPVPESAAKIVRDSVDVLFQTLQEAINEAQDGETIILQSDCGVAIGTLKKNLTIVGSGHTVHTSERWDIAADTTLTLENVNLAATASSGNSFVLGKGATLNLHDGTQVTVTKQGIYAGEGSTVNVNDNSSIELSDMDYTAYMAEWPSYLNLTNSSIEVGNIRKRTVGNGLNNLSIRMVNSQMYLHDCDRQGLVRCSLFLEDNSTARLDRCYTGYNLMWGDNELVINDGTSLTIENSGSRALNSYGYHSENGKGNSITVKAGGTLDIQHCGYAFKESDTDENWFAYKSAVCVGVESYYADSDRVYTYWRDTLTFEDGAHINISNNYVRGLTNFGTSYLGNGTVIMNNGIAGDDCASAKGYHNVAAGGGIYNAYSLSIANGVKLYNNHAREMGDDVYNAEKKDLQKTSHKTITAGAIKFIPVGSNWVLDDTELPITGWFYDGAGDAGKEQTRWNAYIESGSLYDGENEHYISEFTGNSIRVNVALKAAHPDMASYQVRHEYYVNGSLEATAEDEVLTLAVGESVLGENLPRRTQNGSYTYEYTSGAEDFTLTGDNVTEPLVITLRYDRTYTPPTTSTYTLTINYVDEMGDVVATRHFSTHSSGYNYSVTSPAVNGMTPDQAVVSGTLTKDTEITVVYSAGVPGTDIPEEGPPLANVDDKLNTTDHFAYIIGYPEGDVRPEANMTRAEAVTVFFRLLTDEYRTENWSKENGYPDVKASDWFNNAISTATKAGIFKGDSEGTARPNDPVTRAEFAALAARFISDQITDDGTGDFADTVGHWAAHEIRLAVKAGWIKGVGGNKFEPDRYITRAEVMTLVNRMLDRVPDKNNMLDDMIKWPDNMDTSAWYYEAVQEATNGHDYERLEGSLTEKWTQMQQPRDWEALEKEWSTAESGK